MFTKDDYLKIFNAANNKNIKVSDLKGSIKPIIIQLNDYLGVSRFNHYTPANKLVQMGVSLDYFDEQTLNNFENVFKTINKLFQ